MALFESLALCQRLGSNGLLFLLVIAPSSSLSDFNVDDFLSYNLSRSFPTQYTPMQGDSHNPCNASGRTGVCMFTWECVTAGGIPMSTCREGHLFGSCCFTPSLVSPLTKVRVKADGQLQPISYGTHNCGVRSRVFIRRGHIYNGQDAKMGEYPWQASLRRVSVRPKTIHWCGGALLNDLWVITAGHCFYRITPSNVIARLGELDFKNPNEMFPFVERRIKQSFPHPKYDKAAGAINDYDIMLMKMDSPVRFQPHISPICLPGPEPVLPGAKAYATGWGKMENLRMSPILKTVPIPIINTTKCEILFQKEGYPLTFSNKLMCAGYATGEQDACQGDSGGPLQMRDKDGRFFLVGIVSTGIGCAKPNFPGIYLRVSPFMHWILSTMSD